MAPLGLTGPSLAFQTKPATRRKFGVTFAPPFFFTSCAAAGRRNVCTGARYRDYFTKRSIPKIWRAGAWDFRCSTVPAVRYFDLQNSEACPAAQGKVEDLVLVVLFFSLALACLIVACSGVDLRSENRPCKAFEQSRAI